MLGRIWWQFLKKISENTTIKKKRSSIHALTRNNTVNWRILKFEMVWICTFTQGRICWIASSGLKMRQNLVTFPAAAIRTSASLSRSNRTYAGTKSILGNNYHKSKILITIWQNPSTDHYQTQNWIGTWNKKEGTKVHMHLTQQFKLDIHLVGSGPTASQSSYNWFATM